MLEGEPRYSIGEKVTYAAKTFTVNDDGNVNATEGSDHWLVINQMIKNQLSARGTSPTTPHARSRAPSPLRRVHTPPAPAACLVRTRARTRKPHARTRLPPRAAAYNITFEDGDKEFNLTAKDVRVRREQSFSVGEEVEANYKNTGRLSKGKIEYVSEVRARLALACCCAALRVPPRPARASPWSESRARECARPRR